MSEQRVERILDAAYGCFCRHGIRKTTMDDIAAAAGMSRPAVYQYVRNKDDAFRRVAGRVFDRALMETRVAAAADGTLAQRMDRILAVKLGLTQQVSKDSPYAPDLIGEHSLVASELRGQFLAELTDLLTSTITDAAAHADLALADAKAREIAELALALTRGLEADHAGADTADQDRQRERLRSGVALLVAGLAAATRPRAA